MALLRREANFQTLELEVLNLRGVLQSALLVGEVAGITELQLPQTRVGIVTREVKLERSVFATEARRA